MRTLLRSSLLGISLVALLTAGCAEEIEGPEPFVNNPAAGSNLPVDPGIICNVQNPEDGTVVTITGDLFAPITFDIPNDPKVALPDVRLQRSSAIDGSEASATSYDWDGEPGGTNSDLMAWNGPQSLQVRINDDMALEEGVYDVTVTNANDLSATSAGSIAVLNRPTTTSITPSLVCIAEEARTLAIAGSNFLRNDALLPTVIVGDTEFGADALSDCRTVAHAGLDAEVCDTVSFTVPVDGLAEGVWLVGVRNPETASCESLPDDGVELGIVGPPVIDSAEPPALCDLITEATRVTFRGQNFINVGDETFTVRVNGTEVQPEVVDDCTPVEVAGLQAESCSTFVLTVSAADYARGGIEIEVINPESVGCSFRTSEVFAVVGPPEVTGFEPNEICSDQSQTVTITGSNFGPTARVRIGTNDADVVDVQSDTTIVATWNTGIPAGVHDVTVDNGGGCAATLVAAMVVNPSPIVIFVDPPIVYNGITTEVTIFASGLQADATAVSLVDSNGNSTPLTDFDSPTRSNRILATVPAGTAAGDYEIVVTSEDGCSSSINGRLTITDNLTLNLRLIDPAYVSPTVATGVTIETTTPPAFTSTPRAYLNPNPAGAGVRATAMRATVFVDGDTLTAVVPESMTPGAYDVIVVNPTGEVGVLQAGLTVTPTEPPIVDQVTPATFATNSDYQATISGQNLDPAGVSVELICENPMTGAITTHQATVQGAATTDEVTALMPTSQLSKGMVCLVRVTNDATGASFSYSAISITNSSFNLEPWTSSSAMNIARRGLSLVAGRPTQTSRFLYAIGGDAGANGSAMTSVEAVNVGVFGDLAQWFMQREELPAGRTFAARARVGSFLYLVGGHDGTSATNTVYRAHVLDPLDTPDVVDVDATLGDGTTGLVGGTWMYRVAAIYPANDPNNPGGEGLPGDVQIVDLPDLQDRIQLLITWSPLAGAAGYRVYRSPQADAAFDELELLVEINDAATTSYGDTGGATMGTRALVEGSTGVWHPFGTMNSAREGHAVVAVPRPGSANETLVYAFGGRSDAGAPLASVEYATVTQNADGTQAISGWTNAGQTLDSAKADIGAFVVRSFDTIAIPDGDIWIYVGPGRSGAGIVDGLEAFQVTSVAEPAFMTVNRSVSTDRAGYGAGSSNGFLYIFGGSGGGPDNGGISAELCTTVRPNCPNVPPDLQTGAWNSLGISMSESRVDFGTAQESAFYFVAGGDTGGGVTNSVDQTVQ